LTTAVNGGVGKVGEFMEQLKNKNSGVRLMGFGHRVTKTTTRAPSYEREW